MGAPICHIPADNVINDRNQPHGPYLPSIPQATDLASALAAINAMRLMLMYLANQQNLSGRAGANGASGKAGKSAPKGGRFQEIQVQRVVNEVKIASKQDPSTYVTFRRIDGLTFKDTKTGEIWAWTRGSDG